MLEKFKAFTIARPYFRWWLTVVCIPILMVTELVRVLWVEYFKLLPYSLWEVWNERPWKKPDGQYRRR